MPYSFCRLLWPAARQNGNRNVYRFIHNELRNWIIEDTMFIDAFILNCAIGLPMIISPIMNFGF